MEARRAASREDGPISWTVTVGGGGGRLTTRLSALPTSASAAISSPESSVALPANGERRVTFGCIGEETRPPPSAGTSSSSAVAGEPPPSEDSLSSPSDCDNNSARRRSDSVNHER